MADTETSAPGGKVRDPVMNDLTYNQKPGTRGKRPESMLGKTVSNVASKFGQDAEYHDAAGRPLDMAPGPRGQRMMQLGILTRAQKKPPMVPNVRMSPDGKPHPGDMEQAKLSATLQQKYQERLAGAQAAGQANTINEQDPMMRSTIARAPFTRSR